MKKLLCLLLILFSTMMLMSCKERKYTKCDSCGKITNCYKVTYVNNRMQSEFSYYVCSEQCESVITGICLFSGYVKK